MTTGRLGARLLFAATLLTGPGAAAAAPRGDGDQAVEEPAPLVGEGQPRRTLAERIPSVTRRAFLKRQRLELMPALGISLNDPFYRYVDVGGAANYHLLEALAVGLSAEYVLGLQSRVPIAGGTDVAQPSFNRPAYAARLQAAWAPLYGKLSWLAEGVMHFDTYLSVGVGIIGAKAGGLTPAGSVAVGQHYFIDDTMALRLELRNEVFRLTRDPSINERSLQSLFSATVGLSFFLPATSEPEG